MRRAAPILAFSMLTHAPADAGEPALAAGTIPATATAPAIPYRLFDPGATPATPLPLVVLLHGAGERGDDNRRQTGHFKPWFSGRIATDFPAIVVMPQCPKGHIWATQGWSAARKDLAPEPSPAMAQVRALIASLCRDKPVDRARIVIGGLSMGGYGAWEYAMRWPEQVACAVAVCGGGDATRAQRLAGIPVWAFHGDQDTTIPPEASRTLVAAVNAANAARGLGALVRYSEYPGVGHGSWEQAFATPELGTWLAAQSASRARR